MVKVIKKGAAHLKDEPPQARRGGREFYGLVLDIILKGGCQEKKYYIVVI